MWNMKVIMLLIIVGALGTISTNLEKRLGELEIQGRIETDQTSELLRLFRILRRVLES